MSTELQQGAQRVAVEELTGLATQERAFTTLLQRHAEEAEGPNADRLRRHVELSRDHQGLFDRQVDRLRGARGPAELAAGVVRSGLAAAGELGTAAAQLATAPLAAVRGGGSTEERMLENLGVEGAALANKLVILTACAQAASETGEEEVAQDVDRARAESQAMWEELLEQTPQVMQGLVRGRASA